jgi:hypothetical protein
MPGSSQHEKTGDDYDITKTVMGLLEGEQIGEPVRQAVRETLNTHALRMQGVYRGRDMARTALKTKDARIAELQARVAALETERKMNKERIRRLRDGFEGLC